MKVEFYHCSSTPGMTSGVWFSPVAFTMKIYWWLELSPSIFPDGEEEKMNKGQQKYYFRKHERDFCTRNKQHPNDIRLGPRDGMPSLSEFR